MEPIKPNKNSAQTRRSDQLVLALLQHPTIEKASETIGINPATAWRWMQDTYFQQQYREARLQAFTHAVARMQHASGCRGQHVIENHARPEVTRPQPGARC